MVVTSKKLISLNYFSNTSWKPEGRKIPNFIWHGENLFFSEIIHLIINFQSKSILINGSHYTYNDVFLYIISHIIYVVHSEEDSPYKCYYLLHEECDITDEREMVPVNEQEMK